MASQEPTLAEFRSSVRQQVEAYVERAQKRLARLRDLSAMDPRWIGEFKDYWQRALDNVLSMRPMDQAEFFRIDPPGASVHDCLACYGKGWLPAEPPYGDMGCRDECPVCRGLGVVE